MRRELLDRTIIWNLQRLERLVVGGTSTTTTHTDPAAPSNEDATTPDPTIPTTPRVYSFLKPKGHRMRAEVSRGSPTTFARALFAGLPARYDRLAATLSLGQDRRWRREMIAHVVVAHPATVLDVATGPAGVALELADRTDATIAGIDISPEMLRRGERNVAAAKRHDRITLLLGQGERLPFPDSTFDAITFTYLLRYVADPAATITELARVVRPGGAMASLEFAVPTNRIWHVLWLVYTRAILPLAGAALGGRAWFDVGRFLGPNISAHYETFPVKSTLDAWAEAGMVDVQLRHMSLGGGLVMWGRKVGDVRQTGMGER